MSPWTTFSHIIAGKGRATTRWNIRSERDSAAAPDGFPRLLAHAGQDPPFTTSTTTTAAITRVVSLKYSFNYTRALLLRSRKLLLNLIFMCLVLVAVLGKGGRKEGSTSLVLLLQCIYVQRDARSGPSLRHCICLSVSADRLCVVAVLLANDNFIRVERSLNA